LTIAKPPEWMSRALGRHLPRSLMACWIAVRTRPDIIMGYSLMPSALLALVLGRCLGAACVYQMTGGLLEITSGGGLCRDRAWCEVPAFGKRWLSGLAARVAGQLDTMIVRGQRARQFMAERSRMDLDRILAIAGSVDGVRFGCGPRERTFDVAYLGRFTAIKQPDHALEMVRRIVDRRPATRVAMVGGGDMFEEIVARSKSWGIARNIEFFGHLQNVEDVLKKSRVFILTSRSEGLSIALAEAMTCGVVPVVYDVGDLAELVKNGETGWLIPPGDFDAHAQKVIELLEDPVLWEKFSRNACALATANNGLPEVAARWFRLFESLRCPPRVDKSNVRSMAVSRN
jgi:glycosyltransferase involved in cell wall biosynthesis